MKVLGAEAGLDPFAIGRGVAQTAENAIDHGGDIKSYDYNGGKLAVAGATGALGAATGGIVDDVAGPALNAVQKAAVPEAGMVVVNTVVDKAVEKASPPPQPREPEIKHK